MNKYRKLITAIVILGVLLMGAGLLYTKLAEEYRPQNQLQATEQATEESTQAEKEPAQGAEQTVAEDTESRENSRIAPDFSMIDRSGQSKNLHGFIGKPIVLNFWASWCGPCKMEFPDFQEAYETYNGEVAFLMVNMTDGMRETQEKAEEFMASEGYTLPIYFDALQSGAYTYSVYSLPTTYFIDAEGTVVARAEGMLDAASLEKGISMILQETTD